jgi:CHAT domain-containing protein/Flp pilus assembly protein TadD
MAAGCKHQPEQPLPQRYAEAYSQLQSGELDDALKAADQGFQQTQNTDPVWNYKFRVLTAEAMVGQGRATESLDLLKIDPPPQLAAGEFSVRRRIIQSRAFCRLDKYPEAELSIADAEHLVAAGNPDFLGEVALNHGTCLHSQHKDPKAQVYFLQALTFARLHKQPFLEANAEGSLGLVSMGGDRFDEAIDHFKEALAMARSLNARRAEEKTLGFMGKSFFELGDFPNASSHTQQAEALAASLGNTDDRRLWLMSLGDQYLAQKNYAGASAAYSHALDVIKSLNNKDDTAAGFCLHDLAQLELRRNNLPKAEEYNRSVAAMGGNNPQSELYISYLLTSAEIAAANGDHGNAERLLKSVTGEPNAEVSLRWQAQTDLADLYVDWGRTAEADRAFLDAIHIVDTARSQIFQVEQRLSFLDAGPFYDGYVRFLIEHGNVIRAMQVAEFSRARTLIEGLKIDLPKSGLNLQQPQRALRSKEVILAYWLSDKESYLWAVTPTGTKLFHLPPKREIDQTVESYGKQLQDRRPLEESPSGSTLYNMLVKPAESLLPTDSHVTIIPHGSLYRLNFETLIVPGNSPHYWIDDVVVENTSSMSFRFSAQRHIAKPKKQLLLIGDPIQATPQFARLKHAADEMKSISSRFTTEQQVVISDKNASPAAYFGAKPEEFRFIDFVTHGTGAPLTPLDSAIILSPDKDTSYKLYARDVLRKPIHAEIVTISACYGAGDRTYSGEGLVGLAWAFTRAGAHQVIAALWEAEDSVTPILMDDFYGSLKSGKSAAEALRAAKRKMLHSGDTNARPYYWASLQLYSGS